MALVAQHTNDFTTGFHPIQGIVSLFQAIGGAMALQRQMPSRMAQINRLNALSDTELAEMGLQRDRIVHHVFRDIYYI